MGYLHQPHTSAGRVPTDKAFRLFVDAMMEVRQLTDSENANILQRFSEIEPGPNFLREPGKLLSELAGTAAVVVSPKAESMTLKHLRFIRTLPGEVLAVLVMSNGTVQNRFLHADIAENELQKVHNLLDVKTHLPVLREWKDAGRIRYLGVTHYQHGEFDTIEKLMKKEKLDFIQIPYSIVDRGAEKRILPTAADTGTAVLVMQPFESGDLFKRVKGKSLPAIAADLDCTSWAQFFLKFIIGHPAVTCPIPATAKASHLVDNVQAALGRLPDAKQREKMAAAFMAT
jgi:hypothetical protein